jgi:hypothetical protein
LKVAELAAAWNQRQVGGGLRVPWAAPPVGLPAPHLAQANRASNMHQQLLQLGCPPPHLTQANRASNMHQQLLQLGCPPPHLAQAGATGGPPAGRKPLVGVAAS